MPNFGEGSSELPDTTHFDAVNAAIAANPGVFKDAAEEEAFLGPVKVAIGHVKDANKKLAIVQAAIGVVKGGFTGGVPGAIGALIGTLAKGA